MMVVDFRKAVNTLLAKMFKGYPIYLERAPKDFKRPSFLLQTVQADMEDSTADTVKITVHMTIVCFATVDPRQQSSSTDLLELQQRVMDIFRCGYVPWGKRGVNVRIVGGELFEAEACIDITAYWFDARMGDSPTQPPANEVDINYKID